MVTAYLLTSTISTPLWGKLGDLFGRKNFFQLAIVVFLVGSMLSGLSQDMIELIAFRAMQGIGAGGLMVGAQAIIGDVVPARQRGRYMGYFGAVFGITSVAGPLAGGWFTQHLTWRWVFYINVPIGIIALFAIASVLHIPRTRVRHQIDWMGTALLSAGVTSIILLTTWGGTQYPWGSRSDHRPRSVGRRPARRRSAWSRRRRPEPLIPLALFKNRTFTAASGVGFIIGFSMFGAIVYLPLYLQTVHGASPTASGLELLPMVGGMLVTFILSGQLVTKTGRYKVFPIVGSAVLAVGLLLLSRLGPTTSFALASLYMVVVGLGVGLVMQVLVVAVQNSVPYEQLGTATSTATFFRTIGGSFGVSVLGAVFNNRLFSQLSGAHLPPAERNIVSGTSIAANPATIDHLPPAVRVLFIDAFSHALQTVFLVAVPFALLAFLASWLMKEIPLRTSAFTSTSSAPDVDGAEGSDRRAGIAAS